MNGAGTQGPERQTRPSTCFSTLVGANRSVSRRLCRQLASPSLVSYPKSGRSVYSSKRNGEVFLLEKSSNKARGSPQQGAGRAPSCGQTLHPHAGPTGLCAWRRSERHRLRSTSRLSSHPEGKGLRTRRKAGHGILQLSRAHKLQPRMPSHQRKMPWPREAS